MVPLPDKLMFLAILAMLVAVFLGVWNLGAVRFVSVTSATLMGLGVVLMASAVVLL